MASGRLQDKVCIVTGSSSGIGRAIALEYAAHGGKVVCADLVSNSRDHTSPEASIDTHELISQRGGQSLFIKTDVTNVEDIQELAVKAGNHFGRIDILVNNAGISIESRREPQKLHETSEADFDRTMDVNVRSIFTCCKYVLQQMIKQDSDAAGDRGSIINLSSIYGLVGGYNNVCYAGSKGAVTNMTRSIALDYASVGIRCNAICPGYTRTAIFQDTVANMDDQNRLESAHPLRGVGQPQDIVGAAVFLASSEARWVTGVNLAVDGGYTIQ